ncbi:hypothetical protein SPWS13_0953 [Shewanella putrefaciens]|nr:hypothetical protein SPWS13_0953 [Shewanella putrefaciens]
MISLTGLIRAKAKNTGRATGDYSRKIGPFAQACSSSLTNKLFSHQYIKTYDSAQA